MATLALLAGGVLLTQKSEASIGEVESETKVFLAVETRRALRVHSYGQRRTYTGAVTARRTAELSFERQARLIEVVADEGDRVEEDAILALLDTRDLEISLRLAQAERGQAQARLKEMVNGPRRQTIEAAREAVADLQAQVDLMKLKLDRRASLLKDNAISAEDYDEVALGLKALKARHAAAEDRLDELREGTRKERIEGQRAIVEQLAAKVASIELEIEKSRIVAPFNGRIALRAADEGAIVAPGQTVLRLVESDVLEARVGVPVKALDKVPVGSGQNIGVGGRIWNGRVTAHLPILDGRTRTRTVVLLLEQDAVSKVAPGEIARLEIKETVKTAGFWVPNKALVKSLRGLWSVYVVDEGVARRREVEVLHTEGDRVLVRGTLSESEEIVWHGTQRIAAGQKVRAVAAQGD